MLSVHRWGAGASRSLAHDGLNSYNCGMKNCLEEEAVTAILILKILSLFGAVFVSTI